MVNKIRTYGDEVLRERAIEVDKIDDKILKLVEDMTDTVIEAQGVGLAAPQVGVPLRMFLARPTEEELLVIINPEFVYKSEEKVVVEEGCLSIPGIYKKVERSKIVKLKYTNEKGEIVEREADGLLSRIFQHEYDHLDGVLFVDKVSPVSKRMIKKKLEKLSKYTKQQNEK